MPTALVTGPTGFVGAGLVSALLSRGYRVRAYARPAWKGRQLPLPPGTRAGGPGIPGTIETWYGDIRDADALEQAASGCDLAFHTAAVVSFRREDRDEQLSVNVGGTKAVAEACLKAGVGRLVHTSSIAALGWRDDGGLVDESVPFNWPPSLTYRYSKHLGEMEVLAAARRGLDAVVVNPSVIVGPGDRYVHGGQYVRDASRGKLFAYPIGGVNMVAVSDVVAGHIAAAERGRAGQRYILGGVNLTHREAFALVASVVGGRGPKLPVPRAGVLAIAAAAELLAALTRTAPIITRDLVAGVGRYQWYSIARARAELGYNPVSLEKSLRDAYIWYRDNNLL
jgi:dihydroflavonol-4-reductase